MSRIFIIGIIIFGIIIFGTLCYYIYDYSENKGNNGGGKNGGGKNGGGNNGGGKNGGGKNGGGKNGGGKNGGEPNPTTSCGPGLNINWDRNCVKSFDCTRSKKTMEKDHPCLSYKSGAKCVKDPNCIAMSIGEDGQAYICIDKEYHSGLGIGPDPDEKCGEYIAMNFSFPGGEDGCTTWWDRENPTPNLPVEDCCTLNIDPCCMQDINPTTVPGCTNKN